MSNWSLYLQRTSQLLRDNSAKVLRMQGADDPSRIPRTLFSFNSKADIQQFATGCDADIGGTSSVHFDLDESPENASIGKLATAKFWGEMRLGVRTGLEGKLRGGYAGFRNKTRPTLFGNMVEDVSNHRYLALRLRVSGDPRTHNSYFANIQTDGPISTDLWQHRLYFQRNDNAWEDLYIPFDNFVRTNSGELSEDQIKMYREKVRSIGISLLGGNSGSSGKYELGIDSIRIVNDEDVIHSPNEKSEDLQRRREFTPAPDEHLP
ncbi:complex I intermediate-associated protein CIA30 [Collybia nuda]|uniref:Complex I intermediate-associated protein CIA30 n=1 Tax=Collybia nuda TaxID=64659 RepID=A0A9P5YD99_9AGAR|nr:complex I intermediate-associated protein CIA30 [Collybia nuda]